MTSLTIMVLLVPSVMSLQAVAGPVGERALSQTVVPMVSPEKLVLPWLVA